MEIYPKEKINLEKYEDDIIKANFVQKKAMDTQLSSDYGKRIYKTNSLPSVQNMYKENQPDVNDNQNVLNSSKTSKPPKTSNSIRNMSNKSKRTIKTPPQILPEIEDNLLPAVETMAKKILDEGIEKSKQYDAANKPTNEELAESLALYKIKCNNFQKQIRRFEKEVKFVFFKNIYIVER